MGAPTRNFSLALIAAALLHVLLLAQTLVVDKPTRFNEQPLIVKLLEEPIAPPLEPKKEEVEALPRIIQPLPETQVDKLIVVGKPDKEAEPRVLIQVAQDSAAFKSWLKSETTSFTGRNLASVDAFGQTFAVPPPSVNNDEEFSEYNRENIPKDTGVFVIEKDGRRTCALKLDSLLSADSIGANGSSYTYKDCTPKKQFYLKPNSVNNGWSD